LVLVGLGAFLLLGGGTAVGLALWFFVFSGNPSGAGTAKGKKGPEIAKAEVIEPKARFTADLGKEGDARKVARLFLSGDGQRVALGNAHSDNATKGQLWQITGEPKKLQEFNGLLEAISPDGKRLIAYRKDGRYIVDADSAADIAKIGGGVAGFQSNDVCWTIDPYLDANNKKKAIVVSYDAAGKKIKQLEIDDKGERLSFAALSQKGEIFLVSTSTGVHVWDVASEKWARQIPFKLAPGETVLFVSTPAVSPDGKWLLTSAGKGTFDPVVFDLSTGTAAKVPKKEFFPHNPVFVPNRDILMCDSLQMGSNKYHITAYDVKANTVVGTFGTVQSIAALAVSADGNTLAAGTLEGEIAIWDLTKLK
jgi:WD40 repeat protein